MELNIKDNGILILMKEMEKEYKFGLMEVCMKDIGNTIRLMEKEG